MDQNNPQHWREGAGWICVLSMGYSFLVQPIGSWIVMMVLGHPVPLPTVDQNSLWVLLSGMLGLGSLHTYQQTKGASNAAEAGK